MEQFQSDVNRMQTRSVKWDLLANTFNTTDLIPMWIADMDFKAPKAVNDALIERAKHGVYGYTIVDQKVKNAIINWIEQRHQWSIRPDMLSFSPGVVTSLHLAIRAFTQQGDRILIQTPVYTPFYDVIKQHGRAVVKNPLKFNGNHYEIDFTNFEQKLSEGVKAFVLCSPHNPIGRVWTRDELTEIARLCKKYNVLILSDEIHCDLVFSGHKHIPIASLSNDIARNTLTFMSPTKTFNLAGLQASYVVTTDEEKKKQFDAQLNKYGLKTLNTMGITALEAAYNEGEQWLDKLIQILTYNKQYVIDMIEQETDLLRVIDAEGTYLLWIDCRNLGLDDEALNKFMVEKAKIGLNQGINYGEDGSQFMRMNIACPTETVKQAVHQLIEAVNNSL